MKKLWNTQDIEELKAVLMQADAVVIGAGAGLSTSAGFDYDGAYFRKYFGDLEDQFGIHDMYGGGFYPYPSLEAMWAFFSRMVYLNRYTKAPGDVYQKLYQLFDGRENDAGNPKTDYFVITTNVDHQFQKAGFEKERLFYTQGDYGLWQCSKPCHKRTYDNKEKVIKMLLAQGFGFGPNGELTVPECEDGSTDFSRIHSEIPVELVPYCPVCGEPMSMNLRSDDTFVEDEGWHQAAAAYQAFLEKHESDQVVYLELGVGYNTPGIIKYPFWQRTYKNPQATYVCMNAGQAQAPDEIKARSICIDGDISEILEQMNP